jgi:hypothetical protein
VLHTSGDVIVATVAGGMVGMVFYPLTLCAAAVKGLLAILGLRSSPFRHFSDPVKAPFQRKSIFLETFVC